MQEPSLPAILATKFWSEKATVIGVLPMILCSVAHEMQISELGSKDMLMD
jgi:hypothetical protein